MLLNVLQDFTLTSSQVLARGATLIAQLASERVKMLVLLAANSSFCLVSLVWVNVPPVSFRMLLV